MAPALGGDLDAHAPIPEMQPTVLKSVWLIACYCCINSLPNQTTFTIVCIEPCDGAVNQLGGSLPASMSQLSRVQHLDLSHNRFTAPVPSSWLGVGGMTGLLNVFLVCPTLSHHSHGRNVPGNINNCHLIWQLRY